ncbi:SRPBCC domain-containing protein [Paenibacillus sp. GSMTC-2017]|uniref:SRPBCC family protein n=1 Tax=Paenibacillus sp. GSMTC-2017 TaxID=2794350 RepID=UPI0018D70424|nr:SRPBCC domain-containing protein [Paenibacillus sp. GSMTC-2017]MBH5319777.1 SRPBCC domain-containing protein [Paenibacillus sp. GSMTC-2017]
MNNHQGHVENSGKAEQSKLPDVVKDITIKAPIVKVWEAVSTAEGIGAWFMPNNFEPQVGFEFHVDAGPFGKSPCKVLEITPPNRLSFRWDKDWIITFELQETEEGTRFTLTHGGWLAEGVTAFNEKHDVVRDRMGKGWIGIVQKLAQYVEDQYGGTSSEV